MINILKFVGLVDKDNQRTAEGSQLFTTHDDGKFAATLATQIKSSYDELFELHAEGAWALDRDALISFFRGSDQTSAVTGARQALTFQTLASLAGKRSGKLQVVRSEHGAEMAARKKIPQESPLRSRRSKLRPE